mgnify:CR=1 FL=1
MIPAPAPDAASVETALLPEPARSPAAGPMAAIEAFPRAGSLTEIRAILCGGARELCAADGITFSPDGSTLYAEVGQHIIGSRVSDGAPVFTVGKVCHVAGKLFVRPNRIDIMTGAEVIAHVRESLHHAGHHVNMHEVDAPATDPIGVGAEGVAVS